MSRSVSSWDTVPVGDNQRIGIRAEKGDRVRATLSLDVCRLRCTEQLQERFSSQYR